MNANAVNAWLAFGSFVLALSALLCRFERIALVLLGVMLFCSALGSLAAWMLEGGPPDSGAGHP